LADGRAASPPCHLPTSSLSPEGSFIARAMREAISIEINAIGKFNGVLTKKMAPGKKIRLLSLMLGT